MISDDEKLIDSGGSKGRLIAAIQRAFEGQPQPVTIAECDCPDCKDLVGNFYGRAWQTVDDAKLESNFNGLALFSPEAFGYFLPAYLVYSLKHFTWDSEVCEFTIYALTPTVTMYRNPARIEWMKERIRGFGRQQRTVILDFLAAVSEDEGMRGFHTELEENIRELKELLA